MSKPHEPQMSLQSTPGINAHEMIEYIIMAHEK